MFGATWNSLKAIVAHLVAGSRSWTLAAIVIKKTIKATARVFPTGPPDFFIDVIQNPRMLCAPHYSPIRSNGGISAVTAMGRGLPAVSPPRAGHPWHFL